MSKKTRTKGYKSSGTRSNVDRGVLTLIRADYMKSSARIVNQLNALLAGKDIVINVNESGKPKRVRVSGKAWLENRERNAKVLA